MGLVALCLALFLSVLAGNSMSTEGAGMLAEPLGKLTALQELDLDGIAQDMFGTFSCFFLKFEDGVEWDEAFGILFGFFLSRLAGNDSVREGAGVLAEPLGKMTALRKLNLYRTFPFLSL
jgi:hypothetical protein